jgi:hypothetical protein
MNKEEFIQKWSNWWCLHNQAKQLTDGFRKELEEVISFYRKLPFEHCDEGCYYHCTKNGSQDPDCVNEKQ